MRFNIILILLLLPSMIIGRFARLASILHGFVTPKENEFTEVHTLYPVMTVARDYGFDDVLDVTNPVTQEDELDIINISSVTDGYSDLPLDDYASVSASRVIESERGTASATENVLSVKTSAEVLPEFGETEPAVTVSDLNDDPVTSTVIRILTIMAPPPEIVQGILVNRGASVVDNPSSEKITTLSAIGETITKENITLTAAGEIITKENITLAAAGESLIGETFAGKTTVLSAVGEATAEVSTAGAVGEFIAEATTTKSNGVLFMSDEPRDVRKSKKFSRLRNLRKHWQEADTGS